MIYYQRKIFLITFTNMLGNPWSNKNGNNKNFIENINKPSIL